MKSLDFKLDQKKVKSLSRVRLFATPWTVAYQAPPSMGFSRQEYESGLPFPSPGDLPNPGFEPGLPLCRWILLPAEPQGKLDCVSLPLAMLFTFCSGCVNIVHVDTPM